MQCLVAQNGYGETKLNKTKQTEVVGSTATSLLLLLPSLHGSCCSGAVIADYCHDVGLAVRRHRRCGQ